MKVGVFSSNKIEQLKAFVNKAACIPATLQVQIYKDLSSEFKINLSIDAIIIFKLLIEKYSENKIANNPILNLEYLNVLHAVLYIEDSNENELYDQFLYRYWHNLIDIYVDAYFNALNNSTPESEFAQSLTYCFTLIENISPQVFELINRLIAADKLRRSLAAEFRNVIWDIYLPLFNIYHYHCKFLLFVNQEKRALELNVSLKQTLEQFSVKRIEQISGIDNFPVDSKIVRKSLECLIELIEISVEVPIIKKLEIDVVNDEFEELLIKYQSILTPQIINKIIRYLKFTSIQNVIEQSIYTAAKVDKLQDVLLFSLFIYRFVTLESNQSNTVHHQALYLLLKYLKQSMSAIHLILFHPHSTLGSDLLRLCDLFNHNLALFSMYENDADKYFKGNIKKEAKYKHYKFNAIKIEILDCIIDYLYIMEEESVIIDKYFQQRRKALDAIAKTTKLGKVQVRKIKEFKDRQQIFHVQILKLKAKEQLHTDLNEEETVVQLINKLKLDAPVENEFFADNNASQTIHGVLTEIFNTDPNALDNNNENLIALLINALKSFPSINAKFNNLEQAMLLLRKCELLCNTWLNCYKQRLRTAPKTERVDNFYSLLVIEKLALLAKHYNHQAKQIKVHLDRSPAQDFLSKVTQLNLLTFDEEYHSILVEFKASLFSNDIQSLKTCDEIGKYVDEHPLLTTGSKFKVLYFLTKVVNPEGAINDPVLFFRFFDALSILCLHLIGMCFKNNLSINQSAEINNLLTFCRHKFVENSAALQRLIIEITLGHAEQSVKEKIQSQYFRYYIDLLVLTLHFIRFDKMFNKPGIKVALENLKKKYEPFQSRLTLMIQTNPQAVPQKQLDVIKAFENKFKELEMVPFDESGTVYDSLCDTENAMITIIEIFKKTKSVALQTEISESSPLSLLESIAQTSRPSIESNVVILKALKEICHDKFALERTFTAMMLYEIFLKWHHTLNNNPTFIEKLILKKLENLLALITQVRLSSRSKVIQFSLGNDLVNKLLLDVQSLPLNDDDEYKKLKSIYLPQFTNRLQTIAILMKLYDKITSDNDYALSVKCAHFTLFYLLNDLPFDGLLIVRQQFMITLWVTLIHQVELLYKQLSNKNQIPVDSFVAFINEIETYFKLTKLYSPHFKSLRFKWEMEFKVLQKISNPSYLNLAVSLVVLQNKYTNLLMSKGRMNQAKLSFKEERKEIEELNSLNLPRPSPMDQAFRLITESKEEYFAHISFNLIRQGGSVLQKN